MSKEISLFINKFENKNKLNDTMIPSRNRFYINLMYYLQELGHKILIYDQRKFERKLCISYIEWIKKRINNKILKKPNFPFFSKKITNSDFDFFEHTVSMNENQSVINIKPFYLPDHYYFDKMGYSAWSEITLIEKSKDIINNNDINVFFEKYRNNLAVNNLSKYNQPKLDDIKLPNNFFFLPLQLVDDTVNILCKHSTINFLKSLIKIFSKSNEILVIKRHPKCKSSKINNILKNLNISNIIILDASIHNLISKCSAVLVNNSGVGFESLFHLKPVYTFGKSDYQIICRNIEIENFIPSNVKPLTKEETNKIKFFIFKILNGYIIKTDDKSTYLKAFKRIGLLV
ncbi:hypothetical protein N8966_03855 [Candidatus Pelagibacter ubique]|nr:hypothetical protein [Candidatus Pelagibacter ubique]